LENRGGQKECRIKNSPPEGAFLKGGSIYETGAGVKNGKVYSSNVNL